MDAAEEQTYRDAVGVVRDAATTLAPDEEGRRRLVRAITTLYVIHLRHGWRLHIREEDGTDLAPSFWPRVIYACFREADAVVLLERARVAMPADCGREQWRQGEELP